MILAWHAYRLISPCLGAIAPAAEIFTSPAERVLWRERLGAARLTGGCDAWVHAASLGEAGAVGPFVRALRDVQSTSRFYLTSTTRAGRTRLAGLGMPAALAPIDSPQAVRRFLDGVSPARLFLIETELWPHWLLRAQREQLPVAIVSARLSERSARRYRGLGGELRRLVHGLHAVLCQGEEDQQRWLAIGARPERTAVVGNLKSDGLPPPATDRPAARLAMGAEPDRPLLVLGSVRPGEARILAAAWGGLPEPIRARWQVVAVPRHPRALADLQTEASAARSKLGWRWDDRLGVLLDWYRAADVAFVGGSLAPYGGHNPLEPAACGAAVVMGPHTASQRDAVRALEAASALWVVRDVDALRSAWTTLLGQDELRAARARAGEGVARAQRGSARRAVERLVEWRLWPAR